MIRFDLVKQFILDPKGAWEMVKDDNTSAQQHIISYVLPLALIPAIATFLGIGLIRYRVFGYEVNFFEMGVSQALVSFLSTIIGVYGSGFFIHKLAPQFQTAVSLNKAVQLVGFSQTAMLVAGIFNLYPTLSFIILIAGIYSLYVFYIGFETMTNVAKEKTNSFFFVSILISIGVYILAGLVIRAIL